MKIFDNYEKNAIIHVLSKEEEIHSDQCVKPELDRINSAGLVFRTTLDKLILNQEEPKGYWIEILKKFIKKSKPNLTKKFPVGCCYGISKAFLVFIKNAPEFSFLEEYCAKNGKVKLVWGNIRDEYFQTAVQIGNYIIDVANDTVDTEMPKVKISEIGTIDFKNFSSLEEFIAVKESYHKTKVIINNIIPEIAEFYPLLSKTENRIQFIDNPILPYLIMKKNCGVPVLKSKIEEHDIVQIQSFFHEKLLLGISEISDLNEKQTTIQRMVAMFNKKITVNVLCSLNSVFP